MFHYCCRKENSNKSRCKRKQERKTVRRKQPPLLTPKTRLHGILINVAGVSSAASPSYRPPLRSTVRRPPHNASHPQKTIEIKNQYWYHTNGYITKRDKKHRNGRGNKCQAARYVEGENMTSRLQPTLTCSPPRCIQHHVALVHSLTAQKTKNTQQKPRGAAATSSPRNSTQMQPPPHPPPRPQWPSANQSAHRKGHRLSVLRAHNIDGEHNKPPG